MNNKVAEDAKVIAGNSEKDVLIFTKQQQWKRNLESKELISIGDGAHRRAKKIK